MQKYKNNRMMGDLKISGWRQPLPTADCLLPLPGFFYKNNSW
jgi:hypothetical protein